MFSLWGAAGVAALLSGIQVAVHALELWLGATLAALTDLHASLAAVFASGPPQAGGAAAWAVMLAVSVHAGSKSVTAGVTDGWCYLLALAPRLWAHTALCVGGCTGWRADRSAKRRRVGAQAAHAIEADQRLGAPVFSVAGPRLFRGGAVCREPVDPTCPGGRSTAGTRGQRRRLRHDVHPVASQRTPRGLRLRMAAVRRRLRSVELASNGIDFHGVCGGGAAALCAHPGVGKQSGFGRDMGRTAVASCTEPKRVCMSV